MKKYILGVGVDDVSLSEATKIVESWLSKHGKHYIVTPNPEFLVDAQQDSEFKKILNKADLSIPDGQGLRIGSDIVCNTPGIDLMEALIKLASERGYTTGFLGGRDGVAKLSAECLQKKYPKLKVNYVSSGEELDEQGNVIARNEMTKQSTSWRRLPRSFGPRNDDDIDLLFVAFGHPKQEKWIAANLPKIPVRVAMGVGGSFDYISGKVPRAPLLMRELMLEWLFRLLIQPWRIKRQLKLLKYLWLVLH